jgi:glutamine synthetase
MGKLTLEELNSSIDKREIDTVVLTFPDHLGQLMGKRLTGDFFLENNHTNCCDYLLAINIEEDPLPGFKLAGWEKGYGDLLMAPDFSTIRKISWQKNAAIIICDLIYEDGRSINMAPRTMLRNQCNRLAEMGLKGMMASELEFYLFDNPYETVYSDGYKGLVPSSPYLIDYGILNTGFKDEVLRDICNQVSEAGVPVESRKGEAGKGQYEIGLKYSTPIEMSDNHLIYKNAAKTIANLNGNSITFMAKYSDSDAGSSCHIHSSIVDVKTGKNVFVNNKGGESDFFRYFLGGLNLLSSELFIFFAPTINSYKRFSNDSFAPTRIAWDYDNRTTSFRIVGEGQGFRIENRLPGADANVYLAFAATIAAGLYGVENKIEPPALKKGNIYTDESLPKVPGTLKEAADNFDNSKIARGIFGDDIVDHYVHHARLEVADYEKNVSEWELKRYFERI